MRKKFVERKISARKHHVIYASALVALAAFVGTGTATSQEDLPLEPLVPAPVDGEDPCQWVDEILGGGGSPYSEEDQVLILAFCNAAERIVQVTLYEHIEYGGKARSFYGSARCDQNLNGGHGIPTMPEGWNDLASSAKTYNGCLAKLYEHINYNGDPNNPGGTVLTVVWMQPDMTNSNPYFNDITSAISTYNYCPGC